MHVRQQLRCAALEVLGYLDVTGARFDFARARPTPVAENSRLVVRTPEEVSRDLSQGGLQERLMRVTVEIIGRGGSEEKLAALLDDAAVEVEKRIEEYPDFCGLAKAYAYAGARQAITAEGDTFRGALSLGFDVTVYTRQGRPETAV